MDADTMKECFFVDATLRVPLEPLISITPYLDDVQYKLKLYDENGEEYASRILTREIRKLMTNFRFEGSWNLHRRKTNVNGNSPEAKDLKEKYEQAIDRERTILLKKDYDDHLHERI